MTNQTNQNDMTNGQVHLGMWAIGLLLAPVTGGASLGIAACHSGVKALMDVAHEEGVKEGQTQI